jgi:hypothetical protein
MKHYHYFYIANYNAIILPGLHCSTAKFVLDWPCSSYDIGLLESSAAERFLG